MHIRKKKRVGAADCMMPNPYWRRYDCVFCDGAAELQAALANINAAGYVIAAVTQHEFTYTIIFKRFD